MGHPAIDALPGRAVRRSHQALIKDGVILQLDPTLIPNATNLSPEWTNPAYDPGNKYSMPNYWWTTGYAWDPDKVPGDLTSWDALWDSRYGGYPSVGLRY